MKRGRPLYQRPPLSTCEASIIFEDDDMSFLTSDVSEPVRYAQKVFLTGTFTQDSIVGAARMSPSSFRGDAWDGNQIQATSEPVHGGKGLLLTGI